MSSEKERFGLLSLLQHLSDAAYVFVAPTPETHRRVFERDARDAKDLRDIFGWNRPFAPDLLPRELFQAIGEARLLEEAPTGWLSRIRVATLDGALFVHSHFPPSGQDAVFFGPDSYRFARLIRERLGGQRFGTAVDLGAGAGAGAITLARCAEVARLHLVDVNRRALAYAEADAEHAGVAAEFHQGGLDAVEGPVDLVIANPPYIAESGQTYSDGGDALGVGVALEWARAACARLAPGGRLLLYSGSPVIGGKALLESRLHPLAASEGLDLSVEEIDPDVFGEELSRPAYRPVERIAALGVTLTKPGRG